MRRATSRANRLSRCVFSSHHACRYLSPALQKLISRQYLGEILRLVLCELIDEGMIFLGQNTYKLEKAYSFDTTFLSLMESDPTDELLAVIGILPTFTELRLRLPSVSFSEHSSGKRPAVR
jgi:hexokinase